MVKLLLDCFELKARNKEYKASLSRAAMEAAGEGHVVVVILLIEKGAELEARDLRGQTPLSRAEQERYTEAVRRLGGYAPQQSSAAAQSIRESRPLSVAFRGNIIEGII